EGLAVAHAAVAVRLVELVCDAREPLIDLRNPDDVRHAAVMTAEDDPTCHLVSEATSLDGGARSSRGPTIAPPGPSPESWVQPPAIVSRVCFVASVHRSAAALPRMSPTTRHPWSLRASRTHCLRSPGWVVGAEIPASAYLPSSAREVRWMFGRVPQPDQ